MLYNVQTEAVNKEIEMIKSNLDKVANDKLKTITRDVKVATESDKKDTSTKQKYLVPPVKPSVASYFFDKNLLLALSCSILAEDLILNNINIKVKDDSDENNEEVVEGLNVTNIINSVDKSQVELSYMCADYVLNGAGCCKITVFEEDNEFRLTQIPQETLQIIKIVDEKLQDTPIYLVEQDLGIGDKRLYKIMGEIYPEEFLTYDNKVLGSVWWMGGDSFYDFFRKPKWLQAMESMNAQIALESLDTEKINTGFNMNNVLFFNKEPTFVDSPLEGLDELNSVDNENQDDKQENEYFNYLSTIASSVNAENIANELRAAGLGTAVLYEETLKPLTMQHVSLSDTNYDYLLEKSKLADQRVMSSFGIPRERYMINDMKESMNSHRTAAFWEIYTKSLNSQQLPYENGLLDVINEVYDLDYELTVDIELPMFSELINAKIDTYSSLFLKGLLTLKQTVILLSKYITDLNIADLDFTNPIYDMRFINGKPLENYGLDGIDQDEYDKATSFLSEGL